MIFVGHPELGSGSRNTNIQNSFCFLSGCRIESGMTRRKGDVLGNSMLREQLLELNFTQNQADVYLALLEAGQTKVGPLIEKTGFHRNIVYRALDDLVTRKLVFQVTKRGVAYYEATDPEPLLSELDQKREIAKIAISEIKNRKGTSASEVFVYSGAQGVFDLNDQLNDDLYLIGANGMFMTRYLEYFAKWEARRIQKGFKKYMLAIPAVRHTDFVKTQLTETRYLPSTFSSPLAIWISGDTVAHILWEKSETIFVVKNKKIADDYRRYFEMLWKQDSWVLKGKEGFLELLQIVDDGASDLYYLNATGGGLKAFLSEYKQWMRKFSEEGHTSHWLTMPGFDADISNIGMLHQRRRLKTNISSPTVYWIFGEYVANVLWEADMPLIFLIKNRAIAQSYRDYFQYLWKYGSLSFSKKVR